jgi:polysaccharide biosynthesis/export protein
LRLFGGECYGLAVGSEIFATWGIELVHVKTGIALFGIVAVLCGCSSAFPTGGPYSWDVRAHNRVETDIDYTLVPVTDNVISILLAHETPDLSGAFTDRRPASEIKFGVGDIVSVRIFEASSGGLFIPNEAGARAGNFVDLPDQPVDKNGNVQVPYAGPVKALGQTPQQVQETIIARLRNRAIDPQAVVTLKDQRTSLVSVIGEVNSPTRLPVTAAGDRVLDAISRAGGPKFAGHETYVSLQRDGRRGTVSFLRLVHEPANNVYVRGNDTIFVYREPHTYVALGAFSAGSGFTPQQADINFDKEKLNLAEAVGKAFGLNDFSADPASIFLYRLEPKRVAAALGIDVTVEPTNIPIYTKAPVSYQEEAALPTTETDEGKYPVIYNINLRDPSGFFHAQRFRMRNHDVLFASNASSVEATKFLTYLRTVIATVREGNSMVQELKCKGVAGAC